MITAKLFKWFKKDKLREKQRAKNQGTQHRDRAKMDRDGNINQHVRKKSIKVVSENLTGTLLANVHRQ